MKIKRMLTVLAIVLLTAFFAVELVYFMVIKPEVTEVVAAEQEYIYSGRQLNGIDVSGFTREQLQDTVEKLKKEWEERTLVLSMNGVEYEFSCKDFGLSFPEEKTVVSRLFYAGKDTAIWKQYAMIKGYREPKPMALTFEPVLSADGVKAVAQKLCQTSFREKRVPELLIENGSRDFVQGQAGFAADEAELTKLLADSAEELLVGEKTSLAITYEGIVIPLTEKEEALGTIDTCIATYSTEYKETSKKGNNVRIASARLNHKLLYPGESISVNEMILDRTRENGYLHAPISFNGQLVEGMGGGVCQVSSTLYGALIRAGILPDERYPHSMIPPYVPAGLDAAIYQDKKDLKFTNTLSYPMYITASAKDGVLTFELWSNKDALEGYTYEPYAKKISAHRFKSYLKKYQGETLIETIELYTDWYRI